MPKKPINLRIDGQLLGQLKDLAVENHTSLTYVIESFCRYGIQHNLPCKETVSTTVVTVDESLIQQTIQEAVDTKVEAKVKTILADINTNVDTKVKAVEERLASLEQKTSHLTEAEFEDLKRSIESKRQQKLQQKQKEEQSNENTPQQTKETGNDVSSPQEVKQEGLQGKLEGGNENPVVLFPKNYQGDRTFKYDEGKMRKDVCEEFGYDISNEKKSLERKLGYRPDTPEAVHLLTNYIAVKFPEIKPSSRSVRYYQPQ